MRRALLTPGFRRSLAVIAAAGVAVRLVYVLWLSHDLRGLGDSLFYNLVANQLADGEGYSDPLTNEPTALHPPLLSFLIALPAGLGAEGYVAQRAAAALIVGPLAIAAVGLLARRLTNERAGLIAAGFTAIYPVAIAADGALMPEALFGVLVVLSVLAAFDYADYPSTRNAIVLGGLIGLASLTRSEGLLLLPLLALPAWVAARPRPALNLAIAALATVVVIAPWTIRNLVHFERPVLLSTNDGTVLAGANCDDVYRGRDIGGWQIECVARSAQREAEARPLGDLAEDESVGNARFRREGLEYAADHAGRLPLVMVARAARSFDLYQPIRQAEAAEGRADWIGVAGVFAFYAVAGLGIYGATLVRSRRLLVLAPVLLVALVSVLGYGVPRFRHPADLVLLALAAVAVDALLSRREASRAPLPGSPRLEPTPARGDGRGPGA